MTTIYGYIRRHIAIVCKKIKALTKGSFWSTDSRQINDIHINWNGSTMPRLLYQIRIISQNLVVWSKGEIGSNSE
jgi:hypothetical protein